MSRYYSDMCDRPTCVYRIYDGPDGDLLYVGMSMNIQGRVAKHRSSGWWPVHADIALQWFDTRDEARAAESMAIATEDPIYNIARPRQARPSTTITWREIV